MCFSPQGAPRDEFPGHVTVKTKRKPPREFRITLEDVNQHWPTKGCPGCGSLRFGRGTQPHSIGCRERFREILRETLKVRNYEARRKAFEEEEKARKARKEEKREAAKKLEGMESGPTREDKIE